MMNRGIVIVGLVTVGITAAAWGVPARTTESLYLTGLQKYTTGDYRAAVRDFARAHDQEPDNEVNRRMYGRALVALADELYRAGRHIAAADAYGLALPLSPGDSHIRYRLEAIRDISRHLAGERDRQAGANRTVAVTGIILGALAVMAMAGAVVVLKRRGAAALAQSAVTTPSWDESQYLPEAARSGIMRAARLWELNLQLKNGALSWNELSGYIDELNGEVKERILDLVADALQGGGSPDRALALTLPLCDDPDDRVSGRGRALISDIHSLSGHDFLDDRFLLLLARMVDSRTGRDHHAGRVAETAYRIALALENPEVPPEMARKAGLIHDLGYLQIRGRIRSEEEPGQGAADRYWGVVRTHALKGANLIQFTDLPSLFIEAVKYHHERLDGSGYPLGLRGADIPPMALVLSAAECLEEWCAALAAGGGRGATLTEDAVQVWFGGDIARIITELARERAIASARERRCAAPVAADQAPVFHAQNAC